MKQLQCSLGAQTRALPLLLIGLGKEGEVHHAGSPTEAVHLHEPLENHSLFTPASGPVAFFSGALEFFIFLLMGEKRLPPSTKAMLLSDRCLPREKTNSWVWFSSLFL